MASTQKNARAFEKVRAMCMAHAGVYEKASWGEPTFRHEKGKMFLSFADNHHDDGRIGIWCMATPDTREAWMSLDPERFYIPPYVGVKGWVGVRIDEGPPWDIIEEIIAEAAKLGAPPASKRVAVKKVVAKKPVTVKKPGAAKKPAAAKQLVRAR